MITLAIAVLAASVVGSMHCVGMCGPFALWATAGGRGRTSLLVYHLGRLTTYLSAALVAGTVGSAVTIGGDMFGLQSLAARIAGVLLMVVGVVRLARLIPFFRRPPSASIKPSLIAGLLHRAKPLIAGLGPHSRAYFGGLLTTWLPCGWLYLFILVAAGTGSVIESLVVMFAFWVGTLPALTAVVLGAQVLVPTMRSMVPIGASVLLVVVGLYTATGRASADLSAMLPPRGMSADSDALSILDWTEQPLPCCVEPEWTTSP